MCLCVCLTAFLPSGDNVLLDDVMRVIEQCVLPSEGERLAEQLRSCITRHV